MVEAGTWNFLTKSTMIKRYDLQNLANTFEAGFIASPLSMSQLMKIECEETIS